ncbi:hypothetical protein C8J57DRAFT_1372431 [Mycena rebaudengoi]|nr:hypothetical protein C8J57DRAFT_1372431 [Mycena rebaudengoi]
MSATPDQDDPEKLSDNDRLIAALQSCFSNLFQKQDELHKAVTGLKPQAPVADKETVFWNSYMKLAADHDKDFQQRYSTDLDTALIFAGLFSAVSSAFIIQIQPELMPPNATSDAFVIVAQSLLYISLTTTLLAALLAVLGKQWLVSYQTAATKGTLDTRGHEHQRKLGGLRRWKLEMVLRMIPVLLQLALLLFSVALSIYLWTVNPMIAKIVIAMTSAGFAAYIVPLLCAIVFDDCPFQTPLSTLLSHIVSPAISFLKRIIHRLWNWSVKIWQSWSVLVEHKAYILPRFSSQADTGSKAMSLYPDTLHRHSCPPSPEANALLWILECSYKGSNNLGTITSAAELAPEIQWPPNMDLHAALKHVGIAFSCCFDSDNQTLHQSWSVREGMMDSAIKWGRVYCNLRLMGSHSEHPLYWIFKLRIPLIKGTGDDPNKFAQLSNIFQLMDGNWHAFVHFDFDLFLWALHIIPGLTRRQTSSLERFLEPFQAEQLDRLNVRDFCNYLCCVTSFFVNVDPRVLAQTNKSGFRAALLTQLFKALQHVRGAEIDPQLKAKIVNTTAQLAKRLVGPQLWGDPMKLRRHEVVELMEEISRFCDNHQADPELMISAATLARFDVDDFRYIKFAKRKSGMNCQWVYGALGHIQTHWVGSTEEPQNWHANTTLAVESLLEILLACMTPHMPPPPPETFRIITQALSSSKEVSAVYAFLVLSRAPIWFHDPTLRSMVAAGSVWTHIGRIACKYPNPCEYHYNKMGGTIAKTPEGRQILSQDIATWIQVFLVNTTWGWRSSQVKRFNSVLRDVWSPQLEKHRKFEDHTEEAWALAITALSNAWKDFFSIPHGSPAFVSLATTTISTSLLLRHVESFTFKQLMYQITDGRGETPPISRAMRATYLPQLSEELIQAAGNARNAILVDEGKASSQSEQRSGIMREEMLGQIADFLEAFGKKLGIEFEPSRGELELRGAAKIYRDWDELKKLLQEELDRLEELSKAD